MRVLVVSNDASLAVALSLMAENREVVSIRSAGEVGSVGAASFSGTVIDVGTTYDGLEVVRQLADAGVAAPFFLLGDVEAPVPHADVDLLVRPFTLQQLHERLSALARPEEASDLPFRGRSVARFGGALLGRLKRREEAGRGPARARGSDADNHKLPQDRTRAAATVSGEAYDTMYSEGSQADDSDPTVARAGATAGEAAEILYVEEEARRYSPDPVSSSEQSEEVATPVPARAAAGGDPHAAPGIDAEASLSPHRPKPQIHARFRSRVAATEAPDIPSTAALRWVLALGQELEAMMDERPELLDRRVVANDLLEQIDWELRPDAATVWVPRGDKTYEAYATRGLDVAVGIRVPQEQSLFLSFKEEFDAVLIAPLDISRRPVSGIPGLLGESLVASALRFGQTLLGIVIATGTGFTATDRERLALLTSRAAPDFAIAGFIERLRARKFVPNAATPSRNV